MDARVIPTPDRTPAPSSRRIFPTLLALCLPALVTCGGEGSPTQAEPEATGALEVSTATTGDDLDTDGYTVTVGEESRAIGANDTLLVVDLAAGNHVVEISNLTSNCGVLGAGTPRNVSVTAGDTVSTHFSVGCSGRSALEVTTATVAGGLDGDGFRVAVDGGPVRTIGTDDMETFAALASGDHTVELSGLATGCSVSGSNPRSVTLAADQTAITAFEVRCGLRNRILFRSDRNGWDDIWMMGADGSNPELFFGRDGTDLSPAVSADGSLVAFVSEDSPGVDHFDIWVVEADGSNATSLGLGRPGLHWDPEFSPDGTEIVFSSSRDGDYDIYVAEVDGSNLRPLTEDDAVDDHPAWSPDGTRIAFVSDRTGSREIFVMPADGSGIPVRLTNNTTREYDPTWSPDGTRIAFYSTDDAFVSDIHKICANGRTLPAVTDDDAGDFHPAWSPNGSVIAFASNRGGGSATDIWVVKPDGSSPTRLTDNPAFDSDPAWSPQTGLPFGPSQECQVATPTDGPRPT